MTQKRLFQLDSLRFFALLVIVVSHFEFLRDTTIGDIYERFFHNPTWGVDYFFLLSGFGLFYVNKNRDLNSNFKSSINFAVSKIKKIYPIYIISLLLSLPYNHFYYNLGLKNIILKFIINLTLLQSLFGTVRLSHGINDVCWFLSTLFICYFFSPLMINAIKRFFTSSKRSVIGLGLTFLIILILSASALFVERLSFHGFAFNDLFYGSPYIRVFYVFLGMICANIFCIGQGNFEKSSNNCIDTGEWKWSAIEIVYCLLFIVYCLLRNSLMINQIFLRIFDLVAVTLQLLIFSVGKGQITHILNKCRILQIIGGTYGMYIYLLHFPVRMTCKYILDYTKGDLICDFDYYMLVLIIIFFTALLSIVFKEIQNKIKG